MIRLFGQTDGADIHDVTLSSEAGAEAKIITWGAVLRDMVVPVGAGRQRVVLGLERLEDYVAHSPHFGAIAGRYANRIRAGQFSIDGVAHQVTKNQQGRQHLHGGAKGFGKRPWSIITSGKHFVTLGLIAAAGDEGYPGTLSAQVTYTLAEPATLRVEMSATTDAATIVNLCHHSYFNLDGGADIAGHMLQLEADFYTPVDADLIPTGEIRAVAGTPFDFRQARPINMAVDGGPALYDHNLVLRKKRGPFARIATAKSPLNGLEMQVWSTEAGVQFYDGAKVGTPVPGLNGAPYGPRAGFCLEPQRFPDTPNNPHFGDATLLPGETYRQRTEYRFG